MNFVFSNRAKIVTYILMLIGAVALIWGFFIDDSPNHGRWWSNVMINAFYFLSIALGALFFYALGFATETAWSVIIRRVVEAVFSFIPTASIILVIVFIGATLHWNDIYPWMDKSILSEFVVESTMDSAQPEYYKTVEHAENADAVVMANPSYDRVIANKSPYLNIPFFWVRTILYLATFIIFAAWFRNRSLREDRLDGTALHYKGYKRGALFLVIFAVFSSSLSWDWLMSIDTHWFSTLYGWYVFSGMWVSGVNILILLVLYLISKGYLKEVNSSHLHDLGTWVFALSFLWTYLWFSQFMLIWYTDIPEEITYFIARIADYKVPFFGMVLINFAVPMIFFMSRDAKRNPGLLITIATIVFIGHYMDTYMLITPGVLYEHWHFGLFEVAVLLGFIGLFINRVFAALTKAPLTPKASPYLDESLHHSI